ncbi:fimbrial protein [Chromobacterium piscinae]|uniref:fimbrial protein n=1 Tax=Chromobacterium piscinae TaxID=686831 RepID=UPI001E5518CF|nr:fimbrial protein [Chromobacterium piscinae]MCD4506098.1 fimbrial protein [Chromobacterium piscinae]
MSRLKFLAAIMLWMIHSASNAEEVVVVQSRVTLSAHLVASTCSIKVQGDEFGSNVLTLGVYDKAQGGELPPKEFTLWAYEDGATVPGCSAFLVAPKALISFGNPGQLDDQGVVTQGAGNQIRIDVRAKDEEASYRLKINSEKSVVEYPSRFAEKGKFSFQAQPINLDKATAGEYSGSLSFVVTYQ